ncbi:MAG: PEP-CTERM sorting domain-containing protein [Alphaproteobacteria bacterium]|jgi:hypothetical protein|nr:PEP-CTERM sorting domain-containing protein [Alphaproteobacteria bacterium]
MIKIRPVLWTCAVTMVFVSLTYGGSKTFDLGTDSHGAAIATGPLTGEHGIDDGRFTDEQPSVDDASRVAGPMEASSPTTIPEPATVALLAAACLIVLRRSRPLQRRA